MKKRTLALALALGCVFMSPTLSYGEENAEVVSEIEEDSSTDEGNNNSWGKVAVVDDFGDATGQSVISTVVSLEPLATRQQPVVICLSQHILILMNLIIVMIYLLNF